ncbi:TetR/AcrR family transcriptional regulator [Nannocystis sp. ILAH1]|uniref:TetR/AcrR family transcriptional regulator n=1 Tax=unclassified Nannocystis TaxID=2627009 RepID=UPI002271EE63|nr:MULTISPECIES: TetR/AcrR family transcriptional regulator [unclassified Nannocystis]MCY0992940.1 TetR/AcrR family transcriptional regulator [Nannocystis sp. ILAH1]MCY1066227.1 TetR/AcrR family transcriptional regulator [Nannocystis sp. RBIL2]
MERVKKLRADGQRNRERIVAAAAELVGRDGAQASLEEVAQRAGVGSATLHRHFASRQALLEAVFRAGVAQLCERAAALPGADPSAELAAWLEEVTVYAATHRGLATALLAGPDGLSPEEVCCTDMLLGVLDVLVARASSVGALQAGATTKDLMVLANAVAVATENDPAGASRLLRLALAGIRPPVKTEAQTCDSSKTGSQA